jgi:hypothetical protein
LRKYFVSLKTKLLKKQFLLLLFPLIILLIATAYHYLNRPPTPVDMSSYVPLSAMAFIEIDSLPKLFSQVVDSRVWQELAPSLGISNKFEQIANLSQFVTITGLGPEEAVLLSRAQYAIVINGLEGTTNESTQAQQLEIVPQLACVIETHAPTAQVEKYFTQRLSALAARIYGAEVETKEKYYQGVAIKLFQGKNSSRQLVGAQQGSVIIIGNQLESVEACLDVKLHRRESLSNDAYLHQAQEKLGKEATIFAFITSKTSSRLLELAINLLPAFNQNNEQVTNPFPPQLINGIAYSMTFEHQLVRDRYLALLHPEFAQTLHRVIKPTDSLPALPLSNRGKVTGFTLLKIQQPANTLEELLSKISARVNIVFSFALRQLVIDLSQQYGIQKNDPISGLIGNNLFSLNIATEDNTKTTLLVEITNKEKLLPTVHRHLGQNGNKVLNRTESNIEMLLGSQKAAAFLDNYLILGNVPQVSTVIAAHSQTTNLIKMAEVPDLPYKDAVLVSCQFDPQTTAQSLADLTQLLTLFNKASTKLDKIELDTVTAKLPPAVTTLQITPYGILMQTSSPLGAFVNLSLLLPSAEDQTIQ